MGLALTNREGQSWSWLPLALLDMGKASGRFSQKPPAVAPAATKTYPSKPNTDISTTVFYFMPDCLRCSLPVDEILVGSSKIMQQNEVLFM